MNNSAKQSNENLQPDAIMKSAGKGRQDSMLREFFTNEIKDIYWAEKHLVNALPKMAKAAMSQELRLAIIDHLDVTIKHISRLQRVFDILGENAEPIKCDAMDGIVKEGERVISDTQPGTSTRDVGIILAAQKVEHYEISTYGGLAQLATTLGLDEIANLLQETLAEEKAADELLTNIAENDINYDASSEERE